MMSFRFFAGIRGNIPLAIIALLLAVFLTACPQPQTQTGEREYNGFRYIVNLMGVIEITNYIGTETDINIPARIENLPVAEIRGRNLIINSYAMPSTFTDGAFENKNLTSMILPDTVRYINDGAFANNYLTEIRLPDNLTHIGSSAFINNRLTGIVIPDSVWSGIEHQAFEGNQIIDITIGSGIERIEYAAFRNNKIASLTVPSNITSIYAWAFAYNEIAEMNLAEGLVIISRFAFEGNRLASLSIPADVSIMAGAFKGNNITRISVGEKVRLYPERDLPVFELGFDDFYLENNKQNGVYVYENGKWEFISGN